MEHSKFTINIKQNYCKINLYNYKEKCISFLLKTGNCLDTAARLLFSCIFYRAHDSQYDRVKEGILDPQGISPD